jgi:hypothetical protein
MRQYSFKLPIYCIKQMTQLLGGAFFTVCLTSTDAMAQDTTSIGVPVTIKTEQSRAVKNVSLNISLKSDTAILAQGKTNTEGQFFIANLDTTKAYKISASKTDEAYVGVTTFDIAVLNRHILGIESIVSPYALLAGDVDETGEIDGADIVHIRNFIMRKTPSLPRHIWRFIDKKYIFINPSSPFGELTSESVVLPSLSSTAKADFVAIKIGDVSSGLAPQSTLVRGDDECLVQTRENRGLEIVTEDVQLKAGQAYSLNFSAENFKAMAYQFTLGFKPEYASVLNVELGDLGSMTLDNFYIQKNAVTTSWDGIAYSTNPHLFTLQFIAHKNGKLSETLSINNNPTRAVAFDTNGNPMVVQLSFSANKNGNGAFTLEQNYPNVVETTTTIPFNLPSECQAKLTIFDAQGRILKTISNHFEAGYNEFKLNRDDLQATGVLQYRLDASAVNSSVERYSATKKMVVVR